MVCEITSDLENTKEFGLGRCQLKPFMLSTLDSDYNEDNEVADNRVLKNEI